MFKPFSFDRFEKKASSSTTHSYTSGITNLSSRKTLQVPLKWKRKDQATVGVTDITKSQSTQSQKKDSYNIYFRLV